MKKKNQPISSEAFLRWQDIRDLFGCGRSKALLVMEEVGKVRVGRTTFVRRSDLESYLEGGGISVRWPRRRRR